MLSDKALLVRLERKAWTPYKYDKGVTNEVEVSHSVNNVGRFNKRLFHKNPEFAKLANQSANVYTTHMALTLPWDVNGVNILPSKLIFDYFQKVKAAIGEYETTVRYFDFDVAVKSDEARLGNLFNRKDYPRDKQSFDALHSISYTFYPIPVSNDFRITIPEEEKKKLESTLISAERQATAEIVNRMNQVLLPVIQQCQKDKTRWHKSLKTNIQELVPVLKAFNLEDTEYLNEVINNLQTFAEHLDIERLKHDEDYRGTIKGEANTLVLPTEDEAACQEAEALSHQSSCEEVDSILNDLKGL